MVPQIFIDYQISRRARQNGANKKNRPPMNISFFLILALLLLGCAPVCSSRRQQARAAAHQTPPLRQGDVIFINIPAYPFQQVSSATQCPANHVGILFHDPERGWIVGESAVPLSRYTPLESFLARSKGGWYAIRRLKTGLSEPQIAALRKECDRRMGIAYHPGFRYDSNRLFCSKFVHDVYRDALGVSLGELETFANLLEHNPKPQLGFWRLWFLGDIPWNRVTITPASQYRSPLMESVDRQTAPAATL